MEKHVGQRAGHLFALICVLIWGTTFLVSKTLLAVLTTYQLLWLRFVLAYITLWIIHPEWVFSWKEEGYFLLLAAIGNTFYFVAENTALKLTQASNVSILVAAAPIFTALILRIFQKKTSTKVQIAGFAVAFLGVVLVVFNGVFVLKLSPAGDLCALLASLSWAVYGVLAAKKTERYNSFLLTRKLMFYGILTAAPLLVIDGAPFAWRELFTAGNVLGLLYLGVLGSAACYILWNTALSVIGPLKTGLYLYAVPLVTLITCALFMDENVTWIGAVGMVLVISGMVLGSRDWKPKKAAAPRRRSADRGTMN